MIKFEIVAQHVQDVARINASNASRIELCSNMEFGGYTPYEHIVMDAVEISKKPILCMVRRHHDTFEISKDQLDEILLDIDMLKKYKIDGIVFGAISKGKVDKQAVKKVVKHAHPLPVTFHRAFDEIENKTQGIKDLVESGVKRLLTSGGKNSVENNLDTINSLLGNKLEIVIGGGVNFKSAKVLAQKSKIEWLHVGTAVRTEPTSKELELGPTKTIELKVKDENGKPKIKIIEPTPFNPWSKRIEIDLVNDLINSVN